MKTTTARHIAATILAGSMLTVPVAIIGTTAAHAASRPSKADKAAMVQANRACATVPGESEYEPCVIGAFVLARHRYVDDRAYTTDFTRDADHFIVLDRASKKVK